MPILGYPACPEHGQAAPAAAVVFGVSDPDDRVHITRPLLAGIISLVCDLLTADVAQDELSDRIAAGMTDRMVVVDEPGFAMYRLVRAQEAGGREVAESQPGLAADIADAVYAAVQALSQLEQYDAAPLTALTSLPRERAAIAGARRWLTDTLTEWGIGGEQLDDAVLILSELFTNAVEHAAGEGHSTLAAAMWQGHLRITVSDPDPDVRQASGDDEHGRGLELVRALSLRHGTDSGSAGKVAWAELLVSAYACPDCGHIAGCGCDCCPYSMPAVVGAAQLVGGVR
jgi:anti-sigma regulatory factor (Ser/Thr protein kinase)